MTEKLYYLNWLSSADSGNFLCKKFHKTIHTLHSLITSKFNKKTVKLAPHEQNAEWLSKNLGAQTMTVSVVYFTNKLLFISLSWHLFCQIQEKGHVEIKLKHDELSPRPLWESEFAYGQSAMSPDSEQMEQTVAMPLLWNSVSVEQIQDRVRVRGKNQY